MGVRVEMVDQPPLGLDSLGIEFHPMGSRDGVAIGQKREVVDRTAVVEKILAVVAHLEGPLPLTGGRVVDRPHIKRAEQRVDGEIHSSVQEISSREIDLALGHIEHQRKPVLENTRLGCNCAPGYTTGAGYQKNALDQSHPAKPCATAMHSGHVFSCFSQRFSGFLLKSSATPMPVLGIASTNERELESAGPIRPVTSTQPPPANHTRQSHPPITPANHPPQIPEEPRVDSFRELKQRSPH